MISQAVDHFGKVDALVLNAGLSMWARFDQITDISLFNKITEVNYQGSVNCVYSCLDELQKNHGQIISITTAQA